MGKLRKVEYRYKYEGKDGWGFRKRIFHRWHKSGGDLNMLVETEDGRVYSESYNNCADIRFMSDVKNSKYKWLFDYINAKRSGN